MFKLVVFLRFYREPNLTNYSHDEYICTLYKFTELLDLCSEYDLNVVNVCQGLIEYDYYDDDHVVIHKERIHNGKWKA